MELWNGGILSEAKFRFFIGNEMVEWWNGGMMGIFYGFGIIGC